MLVYQLMGKVTATTSRHLDWPRYACRAEIDSLASSSTCPFVLYHGRGRNNGSGHYTASLSYMRLRPLALKNIIASFVLLVLPNGESMTTSFVCLCMIQRNIKRGFILLDTLRTHCPLVLRGFFGTSSWCWRIGTTHKESDSLFA